MKEWRRKDERRGESKGDEGEAETKCTHERVNVKGVKSEEDEWWWTKGRVKRANRKGRAERSERERNVKEVYWTKKCRWRRRQRREGEGQVKRVNVKTVCVIEGSGMSWKRGGERWMCTYPVQCPFHAPRNQERQHLFVHWPSCEHCQCYSNTDGHLMTVESSKWAVTRTCLSRVAYFEWTHEPSLVGHTLYLLSVLQVLCSWKPIWQGECTRVLQFTNFLERRDSFMAFKTFKIDSRSPWWALVTFVHKWFDGSLTRAFKATAKQKAFKIESSEETVHCS